MRIYIFKSDASSKLRAFAADLSGSKLPDRLGPWHLLAKEDGLHRTSGLPEVRTSTKCRKSGIPDLRVKPGNDETIQHDRELR